MGVIKNIETKIYDELKTITLLNDVFKYHIIRNKGFPYASFEMQDFQGEELDTCENERFWIFKLVVFQEMSTLDREQAKDSLYDICEKIIELFDKKQFLDGLVEDTEVVNGGMDQYASDKGGKMMFLEVSLKFKTTLNIKL